MAQNTQPFDLSGKIAMVSGASRGIGAAIAHLLAQAGAHVIISSRKLSACNTVVQEILSAGNSAEALECHIGNIEHIEHTFAAIAEKHGRLDIMVNNAAANPYFGHILDTDMGAFQKTVDVNLRGYFFCSVHAAKLMRAKNGGNIVNVASIGGVRAGIKQGIYSITKAAIIHMTKCFALECGPDNIRVNAILPGLTKTQFAGALFDNKALYNQYIASTPLGRHAQPQEIAGAALYLVSESASFTTGECLTVDGGTIL